MSPAAGVADIGGLEWGINLEMPDATWGASC
jgi:hypothetical protein